MDPITPPEYMDIEIEIENENTPPTRKRKLCELISYMGGSRKRKCTEKKQS